MNTETKKLENEKKELESKFKEIEKLIYDLRFNITFVYNGIDDGKAIVASTFLRAAESCILNSKTRLNIY